MDRLTEHVAASPVRGVAAAVAQLERAGRLVEAASTLGTAEKRLLWLSATEGSMTMREIAERLTLEQSTVNRQVNAALKAGLLERVPQAGRAGNLVRASNHGLAQLALALDEAFGVLGQAMEAIPVADRPAFTGHLAAFAEAYGRAAVRFRREQTEPAPGPGLGPGASTE